MKSIEEIRKQLAGGSYILSIHAFERIVERNISEEEIRFAGSNSELIEDYPDDKYSPSCLLLGYTNEGNPLHLQVSRQKGKYVKIITIYYPDVEEWLNNYRVRK